MIALTYSIGEFSKIVGVSEHTLRFYEREGLIKVNRDDNNIRVYSEENKTWVEALLHLKKQVSQFLLVDLFHVRPAWASSLG